MLRNLFSILCLAFLLTSSYSKLFRIELTPVSKLTGKELKKHTYYRNNNNNKDFKFWSTTERIASPLHKYKNVSGLNDTLKLTYLVLNNFDDLQYVGNLKVGNNKQPFRAIFDTGSSWTWVVSHLCAACRKAGIVNFFRCRDSQTCKITDYITHQVYGKGEVFGRIIKDSIYLSDSLVAHNQYLQVNTKMAGLEGLQTDALMGLGFKALSNNFSTVLDTLKLQGDIKEVVFSFYYNSVYLPAKYKSTFIIGGVDERLIERGEDIHYCKVISENYWTITLDSIRVEGAGGNHTMKAVGGDTILETGGALIDSGTSLLTLPTGDLKRLLILIKRTEPSCRFETKINQIVCTNPVGVRKYPNIFVSLCGKEFLITPDTYLEPYAIMGNMEINMIKLSAVDLESDKVFILGATFMKDYYTVFNHDKLVVGVVKSRHS